MPTDTWNNNPPTNRDARVLSRRLREVVGSWARNLREIVALAADFADSGEWALDNAPSAAHWLAEVADCKRGTAGEWIRIGRKLRTLPAVAESFTNGRISFSKVRAVTRLATPLNEAEVLAIAERVSANDLSRSLAAWLTKTSSPGELDKHQQDRRSITWQSEPDGMTIFFLRLPPVVAGTLISVLSTIVARTRKLRPAPSAEQPAWPTLAQQRADALEHLLATGAGKVITEIILHVRGDGCTLDDGTPVTQSEVGRLTPTSFIRALIHDAEGHPIDASNRRRHPTTRQKRVVQERDGGCVDCGRLDLLHFDHNPPHHETHHTVTDELETRCAPCHRKRHDRQKQSGTEDTSAEAG